MLSEERVAERELLPVIVVFGSLKFPIDFICHRDREARHTNRDWDLHLKVVSFEQWKRGIRCVGGGCP